MKRSSIKLSASRWSGKPLAHRTCPPSIVDSRRGRGSVKVRGFAAVKCSMLRCENELRALNWKCHHFLNRPCASGDHNEAVEAEGTAGARRKAVMHSFEQPAMFWQRVFAIGGAKAV